MSASDREQWKTEFSPAQADILREWGEDRHLESRSDILRELVRSVVGDDFPHNAGAHGGSRGGRPNVGEQVRVVRATRSLADEKGYTERALRAGARGVVEGRTRRGVIVGFAGAGIYADFVLVRYRDVEIVPLGH